MGVKVGRDRFSPLAGLSKAGSRYYADKFGAEAR
jgi:hypothetical protein